VSGPMVEKIDKDHSRFRQIIKGRIRSDLRRYVSHSDMIGKKGDRLISIPVPQIESPRFLYGPNQSGGVGQGDGKDGDPVDQDGQEGSSNAGNQPGAHLLEVEITLEELAKILGEELGLPNLRDKGQKNIIHYKNRYSSIRRIGPASLLHFRRTYKEALKRTIAIGTYNPQRPIIVPVKEDKRYRSFKTIVQPQRNAVIIYMMDVSGSMGNEQKEIVRTTSFWIDTWLKSQYDGIERRYIVHDAVAREVDEHTFYHTRESGGTIISSAYKLCMQLIEEQFDPSDWNIYPFHFSDGDNWSGGDTQECLKLLKEQILPKVNQFSYGQVESEYGSGQFIKDLDANLTDGGGLVTIKIANKDSILDAIKSFLKGGR